MAAIHLRLRAKLLLGFVVITLLGLASGLTSRIYLSEMGNALSDQYRLVTQPTLQLIKIIGTFQNMSIASRDILLAGNDADLSRATSFMDGQKSFMEGALNDFEPMVTNPDDKKNLAALREKLTNYQNEIAKLGELAAVKDVVGTGSQLKKLRSQAVGLQTAIDTLLGNMETLATAQAELGAGRIQAGTLVMVIFGLVTVGLSLVLGLLISGTIARSVAAMGSLASRIATGDLTVSLDTRILAKNDEIGELSRSIESMKGDILANISGIKEAVGLLSSLGASLVENANDTSQAVAGIEHGVETASIKVVDQTSGVTETSATVDQILKNINQLNLRIEEQSSAVTESSASIEQMISNIQSVTRNIELMGKCFEDLKQAGEAGNLKLAAMTRLIQSVAGHSEKLLSANATVNNIAAQTNLLAMNAAIEAAHAGESGKGFAVVADEIRKLAELSARQSRDISSDIKEIRSVISTIVGSSDETGRAFGAIMEQMETLGRMEGEIKRAMLEQGEGSHQILEAIGGINGVTADVRRGSHEITEGSQAIAREMQELMRASQALQQVMVDIREATAHIATAAVNVVRTADESGRVIGQLSGRVERYTV